MNVMKGNHKKEPRKGQKLQHNWTKNVFHMLHSSVLCGLSAYQVLISVWQIIMLLTLAFDVLGHVFKSVNI